MLIVIDGQGIVVYKSLLPLPDERILIMNCGWSEDAVLVKFGKFHLQNI